MALFDLLNGVFGGASQSAPAAVQSAQSQISGGLLDPPPIARPAPAPDFRSGAAGQKWMDALSGISAALKDAGAFMQHQPEAANNVAGFNDQRQKRLQDVIGPMNYNNMLLGMLARPGPVPMQLFPNGLPPAAAAWLLLRRLQQNANGAAQNQMSASQGAANSMQPAPALPGPGAATGWAAERVK